MAKCDLCGGSCAALELEQLMTMYQIPGVVDVCPACSRWASKVKGQMLDAIPGQMRSAILRRRGDRPRTWRGFLAGLVLAVGLRA